MRWPFRWGRENEEQEESLEAKLVSNDAPLVDPPARKYLGILDSYGVSWSLEKAARDVWQNFFDSNKQTVDGIDISIEKWGREYVIHLQSPATYDHRLLLHLGGTTKAEEHFTAGGLGEGTKVLALVLLRDYAFSQVQFGSGEWTVDFVLDKLPKDEYIEHRKGLFARVQHRAPPFLGNFVELKTRNEQHAAAFWKARDLFYHAQNPDFKIQS